MLRATVLQPAGTVTFLFTDIEGSTRRWEQHTEAMAAALARHDAILRRAIEGNGGHVFKTVGDAFYGAFATAQDALAAAVDAQYALQAEEWGAAGELRVRMALHTGAVEARDGDYFGPTLNRVARILVAGHGGQVLLSEASASLVRDVLLGDMTLRDLGEHRLKDLQRPERIFQLALSGLPSDFPRLRTLDERPNNLPVQTTPFIGREATVQAVREQLTRRDVRLLTLLGPGGTGKTRLALHLAADLLEAFADGAFFVPLEPVTDAALVPAAIAQAVGVRPADGQPMLEAVLAFVRDRELLLALDNAEQVLSAAPVVAQLLTTAPRLKVLVTSRAALRVYGESEFPVPPLSLPDLKQLPDARRLTQYDAVRLFVERAQAVKPDFQVTNENAPAVAEICTRLDGLPLAIELAAARTRLLTPQAMLSRLQHSLALLTGGARDLPARQQTLRGAIAWSYDLLTAEEQQLFRRLAVFSGGASLEAVEAVAGAESGDVLEALEGLVAKSLVKQTESEASGEPRFSMLSTIQEFALERLEEAGEVEALRRRHLTYLVAWAESLRSRGLHARELADGQDSTLDRMEEEHENLRQLARWVIQTPDDAEVTQLGLRLAAAVVWFWQWRGHWDEGHGFLEAMLALPHSGAPTLARAQTLASCALIDAIVGALDEAWEKLEESLALFRTLGDQDSEADALSRMGFIALRRRDPDAAEALYGQVMDLSRACGSRLQESNALMGQGNIAAARGDLEAATERYQAALAMRRAIGDRWGEGQALVSLAEMAARGGQYMEAIGTMGEALQLYLDMRSPGSVASVLMDLSGFLLSKPDVEAPFRRHALTLAGAAQALSASAGMRMSPAEMAVREPALAPLVGLLADQEGRECFERGQAMSAAEAVRFAIEEHPAPPQDG